MDRIIFFLVFFVLLISCSTTHQLKIYDGPKTVRLVDFCNIEKCNNGEFIRTTATYTGIEEYWRLEPFTDCELNQQVYLNTADLNKKLLKEFNKLYKNQTAYSLKLKITGKMEMLNDTIGHGHLSQNKIQIIPYYIEILEKQALNSSSE